MRHELNRHGTNAGRLPMPKENGNKTTEEVYKMGGNPYRER